MNSYTLKEATTKICPLRDSNSPSKRCYADECMLWTNTHKQFEIKFKKFNSKYIGKI